MDSLKKERCEYFDMIRVLATVAVVVFHVAGQGYNRVELNSSDYMIYGIYINLSLWPVFLFVMLSGALFLGKECNIKRLYAHNIVRLGIAYVFWSICYALFTSEEGDALSFINSIINGHYHMWFIPMLMGLYILVPVLRKLIEQKEILRYFLIMAVMFTFGVPFLIETVNLFNPTLGILLNTIIGKLSFHFAIGFVCYFVLGYVLSNFEMNASKKCIQIVCFIIFLIISIGTVFLPMFIEVPLNLSGNFSVPILIKSIVVFCGIKACAVSSKTYLLIKWFSKYSFGIYLVHPFVIEGLEKFFNLNVLRFHPILSVPMLSIVVIGVSMLITWTISKVPRVNKYII